MARVSYRNPRVATLVMASLALPLCGCGQILGIEELSSDGGEGASGWSQRYGGGGSQSAADIALAPDGGVVVAGTHEGALSFGGASLEAPTGAFLASLDAAGAHRWSADIPDLAGGAPPSLRIAVDGEQIIAGGGFSGQISLGGTALLSSTDLTDVFVATLDAQGRGLTATQFGGTAEQAGLDVAAAAGAVALAGSFQLSVNFGGGAHQSLGGADLFAATLDRAALGVSSDQVFGGAGEDRALRAALGPGGEIFLAGSSTGGFTFGTGAAAAGALFVARVDPAGTPAWIRSFGGAADHVAGVAVDAQGDLVLAGHFAGSVDLGAPLASGGAEDVFLVKLDPSGAHVWSQAFGGAGSERCYGLHVDAAGQVTIAGSLASATDFGGGPLETAESAGGADVFVARLDAAGAHLWSQVFGGPGDQVAQAVAVDGAGDVYLAGQLGGEADFGHGLLRSEGAADLFLARVSQPPSE